MKTEQEFNELMEALRDLDRIIPIDLTVDNWKEIRQEEVECRIYRVKLAQEAYFGIKQELVHRGCENCEFAPNCVSK